MTDLDSQIATLKKQIVKNKKSAIRFQIPEEDQTIPGLEYLLVSGISGDRRAEAFQLLKHLKLLKDLENQNIHPVFTYNYTSIYGTFTTSAESELIAYAAFQQWLKEKEAQTPEPTPEPIVVPVITEPEPIPEPIVVPVITEPEPIPEPIVVPVITEPVYVPAIPIIQPTVDDSINTNMVTQQMINFNIINGRAVGSIKFVATNNFNPFYYGKNIINIVQFKDPNGANILTTVKTNNLNFTETERDEVISYNEDMQGNTRATVESFVWEWIDKPAGAFSNMFSIEISETELPKPLTTGFMSAGAAGAIAGLVLLGFIIDSKVGKR